MPLPQSHLKSLERLLRIHEERLAELRRQLKKLLEGETDHDKKSDKEDDKKRGSSDHKDHDPRMRNPERIKVRRELLEREIRIHELMIEIGHNPKVLDALGDLIKNREYASEVARDPKSAAQKRGIELPASMILHLDLEPDRVMLDINYYEDLYPFRVTWNSDSGFSPPREAGPSKKSTSHD
jgi:hypothetical protein